MNRKHILPLLLIFPALLLVMSAQPIMMVSVSASENENIPDTSGGGQIQVQGNGDEDEDEQDGSGPNDVQCITAPCPTEPDGGPGTGGGGSPPPVIGQQNRATSEQTGGISAGDIIQRSNTAVTEQYCKTVAGIGDRRCQQEAPEGAIQECSALTGLGQAACVQSENPDGETGTCLTANGRPFICETSTGKAISGSGQASTGRP